MLEGWFFWAVGAALIWGVGQVLVKNSLSHFTPLAYNLLTVPLNIFVLLPFALTFGVNLKSLDWSDFLLLAFITSTYVIFYYAISLNSVSLSGTIWATYPVYTVILSVIFLGETITLLRIFSVSLLMLGIVSIGLSEKLEALKLERWFWVAVGGAVLVGFADFLAKFVIGQVGVGNYLLLFGLASLPGNLIAFGLDKKGRKLPQLKLKEWLISILGAGVMVLGSAFFFVGFSKGPASLVAPVAAFYAAITVVLALIFLKEKLSRFQAFGVALAILGVVLIGI